MFRAKANSDANADNLVEISATQSGCCPEADFSECKYRFTLPDASTVSGITFTDASGASVAALLTPNLSAGTVGAKAVVRGLKALLEAGGYFNDTQDGVPAYRITDSGTNTLVDFFGEAVIASIQRTSGGNLTPTVTCTRLGKCTFFLAWPGSATTVVLRINGVNADITTLTLAGSTAAQVKSALEAAANWPTTAVATVVETSEAFEISIYDSAANRFYLDGDQFAKSDCKVDYI